MNVFACTKEHIPAVVELVTGKPPHVDPSEHAELCEYFREVYFGNPWYDPELPSLVCEDGSGRIAGFYGLIPRPMVFENGEQVRALAPSLLWVRDDGQRPADPLVALRLVKTCLKGPQDLTVANGANWPSKKIWETCGGIAAPLYSLDWFRPIRPARALLELMELQSGHPAQRALRPLAAAADLIAARLVGRRTRDERNPCSVAELDRQYAVDALVQAPAFVLRPRYDVASFSWLLDMTQKSASSGSLRTAMVRDERQQREVGWFIYAPQRGRVARVVQLVAMQGRLEMVLRAAIADAADNGIALLRGEVDATDLQAYRDTACLLNTGRWTLVHARRPFLLEGFLSGKALFTGLDGERWLRPLGRPGPRRRNGRG